MAFVVARAIGMRLSEIASNDRTIDRAHNVGETDFFGRAGEDVPTAHTALGSHKASALEGEKNLFEVRLGQTRALSDVTDRGWSAIV